MKKILQMLVILLILLSTSACTGNQNIWDGFTNESNSFNYILTQEAGEYHLHEIESWVDSSSDAVGTLVKCCHNRFWTSYNNAVLYKEFPKYLPNTVHICGKSN